VNPTNKFHEIEMEFYEKTIELKDQILASNPLSAVHWLMNSLRNNVRPGTSADPFSTRTLAAKRNGQRGIHSKWMNSDEHSVGCVHLPPLAQSVRSRPVGNSSDV
jgi:hypothetical protein